MIKFLNHELIDKRKWDGCILSASNGLVYARYDYLENMSKNWDALILGDYEYVMPLTWNRKYGFYYLYQPFFCASLGIFGNNISKDLVKDFLNNIPERFSFQDIYLNRDNYFDIPDSGFSKRLNYVLPLNEPFEIIERSFSKNHLKNISLAKRSGLSIEKDIDIDRVIELAGRQSKSYSPIQSDDYSRFKKIYQLLECEKNACIYGVYSVTRELLASAVFLFSNKRAYYILVGNSPKGRNSGASHFLMSEFIKDHCNQDLLLDFEGSNIGSIARFYKSFGAKEEVYPGRKINRLPLLVRLFRK